MARPKPRPQGQITRQMHRSPSSGFPLVRAYRSHTRLPALPGKRRVGRASSVLPFSVRHREEIAIRQQWAANTEWGRRGG